MSVNLYMDEQVPFAITTALRSRGVDVLTVQDEAREGEEDPEVLNHATRLRRVLFTRDDDFLRIAAERRGDGVFFAGIVYAHTQRVADRQCFDDLELIGLAGEPEEFENQVYYLPLRSVRPAVV